MNLKIVLRKVFYLLVQNTLTTRKTLKQVLISIKISIKLHLET